MSDIMNMKFSNNSTLKSIETENNTRGICSNFVTVPCYDTLENEWVIITLDVREPIDRFIPEWLFAEWMIRKE